MEPTPALLCARRCPWAQVHWGDMWRADWSGYQLVYLFQRPESMARAAAKAQAEMAPGAWLVSLEFAVPGWPTHGQLHHAPGGRPVWCTACQVARHFDGLMRQITTVRN